MIASVSHNQCTESVCVVKSMNGMFLTEPRCEKTGLRDFRPDPTQTGLGWVTRIFSLVIHSEGFTKAARNG